eukprot:gene2687-3106_t
MKKFIFAIALAAAVLPAAAQTTPAAPAKQQPAAKVAKATKMQPAASTVPAEQRAVAYSKELQKKLSLDDGQYTKVLAVNTECIKRKDALKAGGQKAGSSKDIAQYRMQQYQTILKPDQMTKLKAMNGQNHMKKGAGKTAAADDMMN